jgi:hypothetical protein
MPHDTRFKFPLLCCWFLATLATLSALEPDREAVSERAFGPIQPRVSPDGKTIAVSYQGAMCGLPSAGGTLTYLSTGENWDVEPAWSPDGQRIAYVAAESFTVGELRLVGSTDGKPLPLPKTVRAREPLYFNPDHYHPTGNEEKRLS